MAFAGKSRWWWWAENSAISSILAALRCARQTAICADRRLGADRPRAFRTASLWISLLVARSAAAASEAAMASFTLSLPCARACLTAPSSTNFCGGKRHPRFDFGIELFFHRQILPGCARASSSARSTNYCQAWRPPCQSVDHFAQIGATLRPSIKSRPTTLCFPATHWANTATLSGARTASM